MGHLLMRGWILASLLMQTSIAMTVVVEPAAATSTTTSSAIAHTHHHWSYSSRSLPSRRPCTPSYSSSVPSSKAATPTPSIIVVPSSSAVPSPTTSPVRESPTPSSRPVPSRSAAPRPHWSYVSRPLPQRSQCSASSRAIPSSSLPVPRLSGITSSAVPALTPVGAAFPQSNIFTSSSAATFAESSTLQLTTSAVLSTRTATITACPSAVPDCPPRSRTTLVTTETIVVSTTVCPVTEAARATRTDSASPTATDTAVNNGHGSGGAELTTSTVFSTRTATITACPSSVTNCPLRSKTTYVTTETLVVSTTVCPVADITGSSGAIITTQTASHPSATVAVVDNWSSMGGYDITTSTILSTRVITVTACPSSVTNCPLRSKTTYASTETLVVATTVYPVPKVTNTKAKTPLPSVTRASEEGPSLTTSTILSTRIATVASCTGDDCRSSSSDSYVTTETLVVGTTVYTVYPEYVSVPTEGVDAMAAPTTAATLLQTANSAGSSPKVVSSGSQPTSASETSTQGTGSSAGSSAESSEGSDAGSAADSSAVSGAGSGAAADTTYTTTIIVESCSNDGTCTEYGSTITMAQTSNLAQPTVPPSPYSYTSYLGSGLGWNHSTPVSSAHVWPQSSHQAGMSTAMVTSTRSASAVNALYTGSASAGSQWSMLQVVGMAVAILTAVLV